MNFKTNICFQKQSSQAVALKVSHSLFKWQSFFTGWRIYSTNTSFVKISQTSIVPFQFVLNSVGGTSQTPSMCIPDGSVERKKSSTQHKENDSEENEKILRQTLDKLKKENDELEKENVKLKEEKHELKEENDKLNKINTKYESMKSHNARLRKQLSDSKRRIYRDDIRNNTIGTSIDRNSETEFNFPVCIG